MRLLLYLVTYIFFFLAFCQSFEGTLTYKVDFSFSPNLNEDIRARTIETLREKGEYYDTLTILLKGGDYLKIDNAYNGRKIQYDFESNKLYFFSKKSEVVLVASASTHEPVKLNLPAPNTVTVDSIVKVGGYDCKKVSLLWDGYGREDYYYSGSELPIDPTFFRLHNYEYLNQILNLTKHYPIKIVKTFNGLITISIELVKIDSTVGCMEIPELKRAPKKDAKFIKQLTDCDVMVVKKKKC